MRYLWLGATVLIAMWSMWSYHELLALWPWDNDAVTWVEKGSFDNKHLANWIFSSSHFIAYRPVAAASFLINDLMPTESYLFRGVDILFHGIVVILVAVLFRTITHASNTHPGFGVLAALLFALHPACDDIVAYTSRRSYTLALILGLSGLTVLTRSARTPVAFSGTHLAGSLLLTGALLSNEMSFALVPVAIMLMASESWKHGGLQAAWRPALLPVIFAGLAWARRLDVLGRLGGYHRHYTAYAAGGSKHLRKVDEPDLLNLAGRAWEYLTFPVSFRGKAGMGPLGETGAEVLAAFLLVLAAGLSVRAYKRVDGRAGAIFAIWVLGIILLCVASKVWFWRMGYAMVVPWAMLISWLTRELFVELRDMPSRAASAILILFALAPTLSHSAMINGFDTQPLTSRFRGSAVIHSLREEVAAARKARAAVYLALPMQKHRVYGVKSWLKRLNKGAIVETFVYASDKDTVQVGTVLNAAEGPHFVAGSAVDPRSPFFDRIGEAGFPLSTLQVPARPVWFMYPKSLTDWVIVKLPKADKIAVPNLVEDDGSPPVEPDEEIEGEEIAEAEEGDEQAAKKGKRRKRRSRRRNKGDVEDPEQDELPEELEPAIE